MNARTWIRASLPTHCGRCGGDVHKGDPILVIELVRAEHVLRFVRCAACEGPAPPDLPPFVERSNVILASALRRVGRLLQFDFVPDGKTRAAEREPGEDG
jgi:hypothetical protein